jgi:hypothetical protein
MQHQSNLSLNPEHSISRLLFISKLAQPVFSRIPCSVFIHFLFHNSLISTFYCPPLPPIHFLHIFTIQSHYSSHLIIHPSILNLKSQPFRHRKERCRRLLCLYLCSGWLHLLAVFDIVAWVLLDTYKIFQPVSVL